jgi:acyl-ACP thioesterase
MSRATAATIFETDFPVRYHELDSHGNLRPVTLLNYLQDAAGLHASQLGVSVADLRRRGLIWVLSRLHLIVDRYPRAGQTVIVKTWPSARQGLFSCREFELLDGCGGRSVARATTSWAVLNIASRRPVPLDICLPAYPLYERRAVNDDFSTLAQLPAAVVPSENRFRVLRGDLDSNQHVNNAIFAGWALESVPDAVAAGSLAELEISFRAEVLYGDTVTSRCALIQPDTCLHQIANTRDNRELARLKTSWNPKNGVRP